MSVVTPVSWEVAVSQDTAVTFKEQSVPRKFGGQGGLAVGILPVATSSVLPSASTDCSAVSAGADGPPADQRVQGWSCQKAWLPWRAAHQTGW